MHWEDERYVRIYTRDTPTWLMLPWQARATLPLILRKCDRAGVIELGTEGLEGLAVTIGLPFNLVSEGVTALAKKGSIKLTETAVVVPNFIEAQETPQSDAQRKRVERAKRRDFVGMSRDVTSGHAASHAVTPSHEQSQPVTRSHTESQPVTPSRAVPDCAEPCLTEPLSAAKKPPPSATVEKPFALQAQTATKERKRSEAQGFWDWFQSERMELIGAYVQEDEPEPAKLNAWFKYALGKLGAELPLQVAAAKYLKRPRDAYWPDRGFPFNGFMDKWREYLPTKTEAA